MQSAVIWNEIERLRFAVVEGDWSPFQGVYINDSSADNKVLDQLSSLVYGEEGQEIIEFCEIEEFAKAIKLGAVAVECGFLP